jgi:BirA family biotin operon repressor/biotin-[acetyl-CoA-carboxylase] ligase
MFDYELFQNQLKTNFIGQNIKYFKSIDSTNTQAWNLTHLKIDNGTVIIANEQTEGRGRRGNKWFSSNNKSLTFSIALLKNTQIKRSVLALMTGLAIIKGIKKMIDIPCYLKWPNDIILNSKKLGGVLIETKGHNVVIGVGINVNEDYNDFNSEIKKQSISLKMNEKKIIKRELLLAHILNQFELLYKKNNDKIIKEWLEYCFHINKEIKFHNDGKITKAIFKSINNDGCGILNINNKEILISGGVIEL